MTNFFRVGSKDNVHFSFLKAAFVIIPPHAQNGMYYFDGVLPQLSVALLSSLALNMPIETHGGFDFTGADCKRWIKEVGFKRTKVEVLVGPDSMVVGIK